MQSALLFLLEVQVGERVEGAGAEPAALAAAPALGGTALLAARGADVSSRRGRSSRSSRLGRRLEESRRRRASTSMMRASTSSPERTISSGRLDVVVGQLGDVDQALHPLGDLDEGPEGDELGYAALDLLARR